MVEIRPLQWWETDLAPDPEIVKGVNCLLAQLTSSYKLLRQRDLSEIVRQPSVRLYLAYEDSLVVGMLTAAIYQCPTRTTMMIEDVVVDERSEGQGIGRQLVEATIAWAREQEVETIDLTSQARRAASNFYQSLGFVTRQTNVYRLDLRSQRVMA